MIKRFVCILIKTLGCKRRNETIVNLFQRTAARLPDKTMMTLCSESGDTSMTFRECLDKSLRIAHYFRNAGYVQVSCTVNNIQVLSYSSICAFFREILFALQWRTDWTTAAIGWV